MQRTTCPDMENEFGSSSVLIWSTVWHQRIRGRLDANWWWRNKSLGRVHHERRTHTQSPAKDVWPWTSFSSPTSLLNEFSNSCTWGCYTWSFLTHFKKLSSAIYLKCTLITDTKVIFSGNFTLKPFLTVNDLQSHVES